MNLIFYWPIFGDIYFPDNFRKTVESKKNLQLQKLLSLVVFFFPLCFINRYQCFTFKTFSKLS